MREFEWFLFLCGYISILLISKTGSPKLSLNVIFEGYEEFPVAACRLGSELGAGNALLQTARAEYLRLNPECSGNRSDRVEETPPCQMSWHRPPVG